ncbi:MAG: CZB domain-containing protein [Gammaproteobacteria bacterium]|nr:CZB domain-containing protein [Gammaproteobacteria bacterium]
MSLKDAISKGIGAHGMWKQRLVSAISSGQSEWTPDTVCQDNQCEFGKWLYACSAQEKSSPHFGEVKNLHAQFHKEAAGVLTMALANKKDEATKAIAVGSKYHVISTNLTKEMMAWHNNS